MSSGSESGSWSSGSVSPNVWEVVWRGGLRIRNAPNTSAEEIGILPYGTRLVAIDSTGDWIRHDRGWSLKHMQHSIFLARVAPQQAAQQSRGPWSCGACTYQNDGMHTICVLCGTSQSSVWLCGSCSHSNVMNAPHCSKCFQHNPNVTVKYQVTWQSGLNIRSTPVLENGLANVVGSVPHGTILNQLARLGDWIKHERGWTMIHAGTHVYMRLHSCIPKTVLPNQMVAATQPTSTITPVQLAQHFTALIQHQGVKPPQQGSQQGKNTIDPTFSEALQQMVHAAHMTMYENLVRILRVDRASEKHLVMLDQIRTDTGITDDEHKQLLTRVGLSSLEDLPIRELNPAREGEECVVCLDATPTHFLQPCHHLCLCANCVEQFNATTCPRCRENVTGTERIYR